MVSPGQMVSLSTNLWRFKHRSENGSWSSCSWRAWPLHIKISQLQKGWSEFNMRLAKYIFMKRVHLNFPSPTYHKWSASTNTLTNMVHAKTTNILKPICTTREISKQKVTNQIFRLYYKAYQSNWSIRIAIYNYEKSSFL
jgi:hypothetical protein